MFARVLRILYAMEFLLALMAVYAVWSEVGGRVHLEYMAWYWKGGIGFLAAIAIVRLTAAYATEGPGRRRLVMRWIGMLILLTIGAGLVTYYYHLNEPQDDNEDDPGTVTAARY